MILLWNNLLDNYTPTVSSEHVSFPGSNAMHIHLAVPWRTLPTLVEDQYYKIDAGAGETITAKAAAILGKGPDYSHNLTSSVTAKIEANSSDSWGAPEAWWTINHDADHMVKLFVSTAKRFWRFYVDDPTNPNGYLNIPRLFLGDYLQMPRVQPGVDLPWRTTSAISRSPSGQGYGDEGHRFLTPGFSFPHVTQAQYEAINSMWEAVENVKPVILIVWEDSLDVQGPIYCTIDQQELGWKKNDENGLSWSLEIFFREVF